jgi:peroxiredoxin
MGVGAVAAAWRAQQLGTLVSTEPEFVLRFSPPAARVVGRAGRATLPAGQYRLEGWTARRRDARGRVWQIERAEDEAARLLSVPVGRPTSLALVSPARAELVVEQAGAEVAFHLRLEGAAHETLGAVRVDGRPLPPPSLRILDTRGQTVARLAGESRCGAGCAMLWRPPHGLRQPLHAIPQADLGPFRLTPAAFRFRFDDRPRLLSPSVGLRAPDFTLPPAGGGASVRLSALRGRPVLLTFFCGCGVCQAVASRLRPMVSHHGARLLAVVENERQLSLDQIARFRRVTGFPGPVLADHGGAVTRRYGSLACPRLWLLDRFGVVQAMSPAAPGSAEAVAESIRQALVSLR